MALGILLGLLALVLFGPVGLVLVLFVVALIGVIAWIFKKPG